MQQTQILPLWLPTLWSHRPNSRATPYQTYKLYWEPQIHTYRGGLHIDLCLIRVRDRHHNNCFNWHFIFAYLAKQSRYRIVSLVYNNVCFVALSIRFIFTLVIASCGPARMLRALAVVD